MSNIGTMGVCLPGLHLKFVIQMHEANSPMCVLAWDEICVGCRNSGRCAKDRPSDLLGSRKDGTESADEAELLVERKYFLPVVLHVDHRPPVDGGGSQSLVKTAKVGVFVIGVFPHRVGMMNDEAEAHAA